jgi:hypothetical protein
MEVSLRLDDSFSPAFAQALWEHADPVAKTTLANRVIMALIDTPPADLVNAFGVAVEAHVGPYVRQEGELLDKALAAFVKAKLGSTVDELARPLLEKVISKRLATKKAFEPQVDKAIADVIKRRMPELRKLVGEQAEPIIDSVISNMGSRLRKNLEAELFEPGGSLYKLTGGRLAELANAQIDEIMGSDEMKQTIGLRTGESIADTLGEQRETG